MLRKFRLKDTRIYSSFIISRCITTKTCSFNDSPEELASPLNFNDHINAFKNKSLLEVFRKLLVLKLCSVDFLVDNSVKMIEGFSDVYGKKYIEAILRDTVYKQFVGGQSLDELTKCVECIHSAGIGAIFAVPIEEEVNHVAEESWYDQSLKKILDSMVIAKQLSEHNPMIQLRVTALITSSLLEKISKLDDLRLRKQSLIVKVADGVSNGKQIYLDGLTEEENEKFMAGLKRLLIIGKKALQTGVVVWVDAEYISVNPAMNFCTLVLALLINKEKPLVGFTYQNYLKQTYGNLERDFEFLMSKDVKFAAKLVRGAYMTKERRLSKEQCYEDPIHPTIEETAEMYRQSTDFVLQETACNCRNTRILLATHNENAIYHALDSMNKFGIKSTDGSVMFGQLYGMCDHVSYILGQARYLVFKSVPYGNLDETLPYLARRAQENRSIMQGALKERYLTRRAFAYKLFSG